MRLFSLLAVLIAFMRQASANFDIYFVSMGYLDLGSEWWQVFEAEPTCPQVIDAGVFRDRSDVSGDKTGVRLAGPGGKGYEPINQIEQLEMNFHGTDPIYHWTIYKNRKTPDGHYMMYGLDGHEYGYCIEFPNGDYECAYRSGSQVHGFRKFRCITSFTAPQLNVYAENV